MNKFEFIPEDDGNEIDFMPDWEDESTIPGENFDEDNCPYMNLIAALVLQDKPFGIMWTADKMMEFLKARGYKLIDRKDSSGDNYTVAVKPSDSSIPDDGHSNIKEVFDSEMQDIIMKYVLRIAIDNDKFYKEYNAES